jgi:hypothetical protein
VNGPEITPLQRIALAFYAFFAVLFRPEVALAIHRVREAQRAGALPPAPEPPVARVEPARIEPARPAPAPAPAAAPSAPAAPASASAPRPTVPDTQAALQLLSVLQREGRLVDFIEEDLAGFPDAAIGAAARTVHAGCKRAIQELFQLEPVFRDPEGAQVQVEPGFDPGLIRLTGNVVGKPPFKGALRHHGWRARAVKLPRVDGRDPAIVAPAEVEL